VGSTHLKKLADNDEGEEVASRCRSMAENSEGVRDETTDRATLVARLFEPLRQPLLRHLTDLLGRRDEAEDVVQETYLRLLGARDLDPNGARIRAFVFKVATNLAYDRFRQRRVRVVHDDAALERVVSEGQPPDGIVAVEQVLAVVKRTLLELKPRCRQVFLLRTVDELAYEEIAARLGISKRTVEREMQHALEACQRRVAARTRR
jgi:RNA polymerase sigma factor (sigma-70 family)